MKVADDVWHDFRAGLGGRAVSERLGELVERDVARKRVAAARSESARVAELLAGVRAADELRGDLEVLTRRLEAAADRAQGTGSQ